MESCTPEHNTYLSCLLDDVTGTEEVVKTRQDFCKIYHCIKSVNSSNCNMYYTGSKAEGLDLQDSDKDYMIDSNNLFDIEVSQSTEDLVHSTHKNKFLIVTDDVPPAFVLLKCVTVKNNTNHPVEQMLFRSIVNMGNAAYLSSQQFVTLSPSLPSEPEVLRVQEPSIEIWHEYADTSKCGRDNVPSILCKYWPTSAAEWKDRPRKYGWPSQRDKENIEQFGCHLVPIGHPLSAQKSLECRFSFSIAERTLVWSFNHTQMQCYAVMKLILKDFVK